MDKIQEIIENLRLCGSNMDGGYRHKLCNDLSFAVEAQGELIKRQELSNKDTEILDWREVMGWMYADACTTIDRGEDYRKIEFPSIVERAKKRFSN